MTDSKTPIPVVFSRKPNKIDFWLMRHVASTPSISGDHDRAAKALTWLHRGAGYVLLLGVVAGIGLSFITSPWVLLPVSILCGMALYGIGWVYLRVTISLAFFVAALTGVLAQQQVEDQLSRLQSPPCDNAECGNPACHEARQREADRPSPYL